MYIGRNHFPVHEIWSTDILTKSPLSNLYLFDFQKKRTINHCNTGQRNNSHIEDIDVVPISMTIVVYHIYVSINNPDVKLFQDKQSIFLGMIELLVQVDYEIILLVIYPLKMKRKKISDFSHF